MSIPSDADENIGDNLRRADEKNDRDEPGDAEEPGRRSAVEEQQSG